MEPIPHSYIMEFSEGLSDISPAAKAKMRQALYKVDLSDINAARAQIADIMEQVVGAADAIASVMAAGFYDGIREFQTGSAMGAIADSGRDPESTKNAVYGITQRLVENPDIEEVIPLLEQRVGYEIKRSAGRTMFANGDRDSSKPKFARVPMGADSCEFCRMLASRGFAYNSELSAGKYDPDHYHDGCRCEVVCSWEKDPRIAGLSEEEYNDRAYGEHRGAYKSWASKDHSQHEQHQKEKRRNRYTEDGKLRAGYSGERIDKQEVYTAEERTKTAARAAAARGDAQRGNARKTRSIINRMEDINYAKFDAVASAEATEYAEIYDVRTWKRIDATTGTAHSVEISIPNDGHPENYYVVHFHPTGGTFSAADIEGLCDAKIHGIEARGPNKEQWIMSPTKTARWEDFSDSCFAQHNRRFREIKAEMQDKYNIDEVWESDEAMLEAETALRKDMHQWYLDNSSKFGFEYSFPETE